MNNKLEFQRKNDFIIFDKIVCSNGKFLNGKYLKQFKWFVFWNFVLHNAKREEEFFF